ncbi:MAG: aldo/keto reductase [Oscillospiraceae bacterium]|nr:aldo/keto reductase [Oscillospiraceae bacterium]
MSIDTSKMPKLGFGLMRLPQKDEQIDLEQVCQMVDAYMAAGMNYFDTAYVYHSGNSETAAKAALVERYPRESFYLATKLPAWCMSKPEDRDRIFHEQLERCGVEYFDYYLLHSVEEGGNGETYERLDCYNWGMAKKAEGKIRHFGFSFHGSPAYLEQVLDAHPEIEFVQIQLNYADWENPVVRSGELYGILHQRGIPMIVMEPVKGGTLASLRPELEELFRAERPEKSVASWALRFVGSLPGVMTILSGMSSPEQMADNLSTFRDFEALSPRETGLVERVRDAMLDVEQIGCTACRYCTDGCPMRISIPDVFKAVNTMKLYQEEFRPKSFYKGLIGQGYGRASDCVACGQCEGVCPQHLPIIELLQNAAAVLDKE